jgi:hypothetical protein
MFRPYDDKQNFFVNGNLAVNNRAFTSAALNLASGAFWTADRWLGYIASGAGTIALSTTVPTNGWSKNSIMITKVAGGGDVYIGQRIKSSTARLLNNKVITVSFMVKSGASSAFTPGLLIQTPTATDDYTAVTTQVTTNLTSAPGAASGFTRISATFLLNVSAAAIANGLQILVSIPSTALTIVGQTFHITEAMLSQGNMPIDFSLAGKTDQNEIILCGTINDTSIGLGFVDIETPSNKVRNVNALSEINTAANTTLDVILDNTNTALLIPAKLTAAGKVFTVSTTTVTMPDGRKKTLPLLDGKSISGLSGTYNISTGVGTGNFVTPTTLPTVVNGDYCYIGFEIRADQKIYALYGKPNAVLGSATYPTFVSGVPVGICPLQYTGGVWSDIVTANINQFVGAGSGGAGGDSSFKIREMNGSIATLNAGFIQLSNGYTLVTGAGSLSDTTNVDINIDLATLIATPANTTTYYLYIDLWKLSDPITLTDNGRKVINVANVNQFYLTTTSPDLIQLYRYVYVGFVHSADTGNTYTGTNSAFGTSPSKVHMMLDEVNPVEIYETTVTTNSNALVLSHGLTGEPQSFAVFYYDGTNKQSVDLSSVLMDKSASSLTIDTQTANFDFTGGKYLEVKAFYNNRYTKTAVALANQYTSSWFSTTATTSLTHNLGNKEMIKGATVLEWDVTAGKIRSIDPTALITNWDDTNITLDWTGLLPTSTLKYQVIVGNAPLATAIPLQYGGYTKLVGFGAGTYGTLEAAYNDSAAGDSILVGKNHTQATTLTLNKNNVEVKFMPNTAITFSTAAGLVVSGNNNDIVGASWIFTTTAAAAISITGHDNSMTRNHITVNAGAVITDLFNLNSAVRTYVETGVDNSGTITNAITEVGIAPTTAFNEFNLRGV